MCVLPALWRTTKDSSLNAAIFCCPFFILTKGVDDSGYLKKHRWKSYSKSH